MMNKIWAMLFLVAFVYSIATGRLEPMAEALTESSEEAVLFILRLSGVMALWSGIMEIAERTGLIIKISKLLLPFTTFLFPKQKDAETLSYIVISFMGNIFGTGNSSTVFALRTMEKLDAENLSSPNASDDMCTFAIVNMAFAPLIPILMIQLRTQLNSAAPYSILFPAIITASGTVIISIIACKILERRR